MTLRAALLVSAVLTGMGLAVPAVAQEVALPAPAATKEDPSVDFAADSLEYDDNLDIVTASGEVRMVRDGNRVRADRIIWDRKSGQVRAEGSVIIEGAEGDRAARGSGCARW